MSVYLREAIEKDVNLLYEWANDEEVRKSAFSTEYISYSEHLKWFENILQNPNVIQYIFIADGKPIGQVRLDIAHEKAEIDISISSEKRGMGYGKKLCHLLIRTVKRNYPQINVLCAKVKPDNIASKFNFKSNGFIEKYQEYELDMNSIKDNKFSEIFENQIINEKT